MNKPLRNTEKPHQCLYMSMNIVYLYRYFDLAMALTMKTQRRPCNRPPNGGIKQPTNKSQARSDFFQFYQACSTLTLRACYVNSTLSGLGWRSHKVRVVGRLGEEVCLCGQIARLRLCRYLQGVRRLARAKRSRHRVSRTS